MDSGTRKIPRVEEEGELRKTEMTLRISPEDSSEAARRVARLQEELPLQQDPRELTQTSLLKLTSTQILNYFSGKKKRSVNAEIETDHAGARPEEQVVFSSQEEHFPLLGESYDLHDEIASGGQGVIHTARDRALGRCVAVKSLHRELCEKESARNSFLTEARVTASLDHPSIVPVYGLYSDSGNGLHLAMKLLRGKSLKEYCSQILSCYRKKGVVAFDEEESLLFRLDIFLRVCDAISYSHAKGVIHCDLKPENIILGEYRDVYVMDWGIARKLGPDGLCQPEGHIMGTPRYTSPENLLNLPCDVRSDVYTLGVILFELVTLRTAFSGRTVQSVVEAVKQNAVAPLVHRFGYRIPRDLAAIIRKAMALKPEDRYANVEAFARDLRSYLRGGEVAANPDNLLGKAVRWSMHHKKLFFVLMLIGVLAGVGSGMIGVFTNLARVAIMERDREAVINEAFAGAFQISDRLERQFSHIAGQLSLLNSDIALLLSLPPQDVSFARPFIPLGRYKEELARYGGGVMGPFVSQPIDLEHAVIVMGPEKQERGLASRRQLEPIFERLRNTVYNSLWRPRLGEVNPRGREEYLAGRLPARWAYFALHNGLSCFFPASDDFPLNYDGRSRPWFRKALNRGGEMVWSEPYLDVGEIRDVVLTCSREIVGTDRHSYGVSAIDVPLSVVSRTLGADGAHLANLVERMLIDEAGNVVLHQWGPFARSSGASAISQMPGGSLSKFRNERLFRAIRRKRNGTLCQRETGGENLYVFSYIPSTRYTYLERHDLDRMIARRTSEVRAKRVFGGEKLPAAPEK